MCGLAGFVDRAHRMDRATAAHVLQAMSESLRHRGPDDGQTWIDGEVGVALASRRLAIQDLSAAGSQPMVSKNGRYVLLFNGEAYNAGCLRDALASSGVRFVGRSDTEVILAEIERRGVPCALPLLQGMFAIACWDRRDRVLHLARDRAGKKPLYFGFAGDTIFFASQPKAFLLHPSFRPEIDPDALCAFFRFGYIPAPLTIFRGIEKLRPGEHVSVLEGRIASRRVFWDCIEQAAAGRCAQPESDQAATDQLELLIGDAVERRLVSDVPIGAFLSGGVDSSIVLALMRVRSARRVKAFSIGFDDPEYDETHHAQDVAMHLGVEHHVQRVGASELCDSIALMPEVYDEPFADPSQVPTYLLARLARNHVTVAFSGDGGDELFGGYARYAALETLAFTIGCVPRAMRSSVATALRCMPSVLSRLLEPFVPRRFGSSPLSARLARVADALNSDAIECQYQDLVGRWRYPEDFVFGAQGSAGMVWAGALRKSVPDVMRLGQLIDLLSYLPDNILVKVDRASMAVGLEVRAPLLDQRMLEFAWSLPRKQLLRRGVSKWLLRQVLYRHVPKVLVDRPKMGFGFPLAGLLRRELRDWAESLLDPRRMRAATFLETSPIADKWQSHQRGRADWSYDLWCALMLEAWLQRHKFG